LARLRRGGRCTVASTTEAPAGFPGGPDAGVCCVGAYTGSVGGPNDLAAAKDALAAAQTA